MASSVNELRGNPKARSAAAASLFVVDGVAHEPKMDRSDSRTVVVRRNPSWMATWTLGPREMLALCWVFTPFHISSMIARTDHLFPVLDELEGEAITRIPATVSIFAHLAVRGNVH